MLNNNNMLMEDSLIHTLEDNFKKLISFELIIFGSHSLPMPFTSNAMKSSSRQTQDASRYLCLSAKGVAGFRLKSVAHSFFEKSANYSRKRCISSETLEE